MDHFRLNSLTLIKFWELSPWLQTIRSFCLQTSVLYFTNTTIFHNNWTKCWKQLNLVRTLQLEGIATQWINQRSISFRNLMIILRFSPNNKICLQLLNFFKITYTYRSKTLMSMNFSITWACLTKSRQEPTLSKEREISNHLRSFRLARSIYIWKLYHN